MNIMNKFFTGILVMFFFMLLNGCQKKIDEFIPDSNSLNAPDTVWQAVVPSGSALVSLRNDLKQLPAYDSFAYNNTGIVFNSGNYSLTVPPNALSTAGGILTVGSVVRESLLLQRKGDYIIQSMPTISAGRLLISGGEFLLGLKTGSSELHVSTGDSLTIKFNSTNLFPATYVYNLTGDITTGYEWALTTEPALNRVNTTPAGYEVIVNRLQWVQPAYLFDTTGIPETIFSLKLPSNYTNVNTEAYISFNGMQCVANMNGNVGNRSFVSGPLPVGQPVTIVVISKQAGDYYLGIVQTTTALPSSGTGTQEAVITPVKTSLAGIRSYLANL